MKRLKAWTLVELVVAMGFIAVISGFLLTTVKPQSQNAKIYVYATIQNLMKAIVAVGDKYDNQDGEPVDGNILYQKPSTNDDTFCLQMADVFSLKQAAVCAKSTASSTANLVLANGVEIFGLSSTKKTLFDDSTIEYKDIAIDIDGKSKGMNRLGIDRFPLRIFKDRIILPVNCNSSADKIYDYGQNKDQLVPSASPFCKEGKEFSGTTSTKNFMLDQDIITYDLYRGKTDVESDSTEAVKADIIASKYSAAAALCGAYGGKRYLSTTSCAKITSAALKIHPKCPTDEMCDTCATSPSICPQKLDNSGQTTVATCKTQVTSLDNNKYSCVFLLHKPAGGMSMVLEGLIGNLDEE